MYLVYDFHNKYNIAVIRLKLRPIGAIMNHGQKKQNQLGTGSSCVKSCQNGGAFTTRAILIMAVLADACFVTEAYTLFHL